MLTIVIVNSGLERLAVADRDALLARVAAVGRDWLRARSLLLPGTLVSVRLQREVDLKVVSWGWGVGGEAFWVDELGGLTKDRPRPDD
jgi:hypothetical protein